jgi:hypothetical protein
MPKVLPEGTHHYNKSTEKAFTNYGLQSHHMPPYGSFSNSKLTAGKGIAIPMEPEDHAKTKSHGSRIEATNYRNMQSDLIKNEGLEGYQKAYENDKNDLKSIPSPTKENPNRTLYEKHAMEIEKTDKLVYGDYGREVIAPLLAQQKQEKATKTSDKSQAKTPKTDDPAKNKDKTKQESKSKEKESKSPDKTKDKLAKDQSKNQEKANSNQEKSQSQSQSQSQQQSQSAPTPPTQSR